MLRHVPSLATWLVFLWSSSFRTGRHSARRRPRPRSAVRSLSSSRRPFGTLPSRRPEMATCWAWPSFWPWWSSSVS